MAFRAASRQLRLKSACIVGLSALWNRSSTAGTAPTGRTTLTSVISRTSES